MMMLKTFYDYAHFYLNCQVKTQKGIGFLESVDCEGIAGVRWSHDHEDYDEFKLSRVKPLLKPVSKLTEEDARSICYDADYTLSNSVVFLWDGMLNGFKANFQQTVQLINSFRKHGYDCDGLIQAGLALDITSYDLATKN
jgi:hypothetical protein